MKICVTSDLHGILPKIEEPCEVVLICGDIMPLRMQRNIPQSEKWLKTTFAEWVNNLPCESVIMVGGNHDFALANMYRQPLKISSILSNPTNGKLELLDNEETSVISKDGKIYSIWGTPYCKIFGNWAYMYEPETLIKAYESMPQYCDIIISHDAPRLLGLGEIHEGAWAGKDAGNTWLADEIMRKQPKHCFCGHIHSGCHGIQEFNGMKFSNVSLVNEDYVVSYKPLYLNV